MSWPIGSDLYVKFSDIRRNDTNAKLTSGTSCTCQLLTSSGAALASADAISMAQVGSTAVWDGTIPAADTTLMEKDTRYIVRVTYTDDSGWVRIVDKTDTATYD